MQLPARVLLNFQGQPTIRFQFLPGYCRRLYTCCPLRQQYQNRTRHSGRDWNLDLIVGGLYWVFV